jgi:putative spermidine/putrescine transport system substrate-binding protein
MNSKLRRAASGLVLVAAAAVALTACASNGSPSSASNAKDCKTLSTAQASKATSADDFGGLDCLTQAAEKEGHLNLIADPPSWANYGKIIAAFQKKYPQIKVNDENPNGSSQDEVDAAKSTVGQSTAPDTFDMGTAVLQANLDVVTPYKVQNWSDIPDDFKDADGKWYYDYTGVISIGYDSTKIKKAPTSLDDLLGSDYKNAVAIKDSPIKANESASDVYWAALQAGGTADNVQPGIDFFAKLKQAGNFVPTIASQATVNSGETPVVLQWSYNNVAWGDQSQGGNPNFKNVVLPGTALGSYYNQAVSATAADPAAARLWEEFIYSPTAQNLYYAAGAFPSTLATMVKNGTVDKAAQKSVGDLPKDFVQLTDDQTAAAAKLLQANWDKQVG